MNSANRRLNLGCGLRFHPDWTNLDATSCSPHVFAYDCRKGIPFANDSFDVVYHSHFLEHFSKQEALGLLQECHRVLRSAGIIRVAVPDLEVIARMYLQSLEKVLAGEEEWRHHYDWMMLELFDQAVREYSGGCLLDYLKQDPLPNLTFILERAGGEVRRILQVLKTRSDRKDNRLGFVKKLSRSTKGGFHFLRDRFNRLLVGAEDYKALQIGRFRLSREVHKWMYDRYSLAQLLKKAGFQNPQRVGAVESQIKGWASFHLDTEADGTVYKPDSLYMEAVKP